MSSCRDLQPLRSAAILRSRSHVPSTSRRRVSVNLLLSVSACSVLILFLPTAFSLPPFGWGCPPCDNSTCPPVTCGNSSQYIDEACGCCVLCAKEEGERCGGRGGGSEGGKCRAGLRCAYRLGSIFGESSVGVCESGRCGRKMCDYRQRCAIFKEDGGVRKQCHCDYFHCENKLNRVCGRDGQNYDSVCELQRAECLAGRPIGIRQEAECPSEKPTSPVLVPGPSRCIYNDAWYEIHDILPPTASSPCTYHVCSDYGYMEQYPVLGCEGNPPEADWEVETVVLAANWTQWSQFSECVGDCEHGGWQYRTRTCTNPPPPSMALEVAPSVLSCEGVSYHSQLCTPPNCTICHYTSWSSWSHCSTTCNGGIRTRYRNVTQPPTVPELCTFSETTPCQLVECTECAGKTSDFFNIVNTNTSCQSNYERFMLLCTGSCGDGLCCRSNYPTPDQRLNRPGSGVITWEIECPDSRGQPYTVNVLQVLSCECRDCNADYTEPFFLEPNWKIVY